MSLDEELSVRHAMVGRRVLPQHGRRNVTKRFDAARLLSDASNWKKSR